MTPSDFALINTLGNEQEAGHFMLHQIDFDAEARQVTPSLPTPEELTEFRVPAVRHGAYENLWRSVTMLGMLANTMMWIYV